jgi:hypothetical protein
VAVGVAAFHYAERTNRCYYSRERAKERCHLCTLWQQISLCLETSHRESATIRPRRRGHSFTDIAQGEATEAMNQTPESMPPKWFELI